MVFNSGNTVVDKTDMVSALIHKYGITNWNIHVRGNFSRYEKVQQGTSYKMRVRKELSDQRK